MTITLEGATLIVLLAWGGSALILFAGRIWLTSSIQKRVEHGFNEKLERLRSELTAKESEIASIRNTVLSGSANRQELFNRRRFEAAERVWKAVIDLSPFKSVAAMMAVIKFEESAKHAPNDPNVRRFFETIGKVANFDPAAQSSAKYEQAFVSPTVWAYFSAYSAVVYGSYARAKVLEFGIGDAPKFFKDSAVRDLLKAALPHMSAFIDEHPLESHYYLLDELEKLLLGEIVKSLEGKEVDKAGLERAAEIMSAMKNMKSSGDVSLAGTPMAHS